MSNLRFSTACIVGDPRRVLVWLSMGAASFAFACDGKRVDPTAINPNVTPQPHESTTMTGPPVVDPASLATARASSERAERAFPNGAQVEAAQHPDSMSGLRRTRWTAVETGGPFTEMTFADSLATFAVADGSSVSLAADLSGAHPACLGLRYCALTPTGDGQLVRYLFVELGGLLTHADCEGVDQHGDAWPLRHQELVATHGQQLVVQEATTVCWQTGQPPYRPVETASSAPSPPVVATPPH